jgi:hypothetical protein
VHGSAPSRKVRVKYSNGKIGVRWEVKELHHRVPQADGVNNDPSNLVELWPTDHANVDPHRFAGYEVLDVLEERMPEGLD